VVVVVALAASGCTTSGINPAPVPPGTTSLSEQLDSALVQYCSAEYNATATGRSEFTHATWGQSLLATCLTEDGTKAIALIVDRDGVAQWEKVTTGTRDDPQGYPDSYFTAYTPLQPVSDLSGNLFITYDTDSLDGMTGVEILRPSATGAESVSLNNVEWTSVWRQSDEAAFQILRALPLFSRAVAVFNEATGLYDIQVMGVNWADNDSEQGDPLKYRWTGGSYYLALDANEWLIDAVEGVTSAPVYWARVKIADARVTATLCISHSLIAVPTCNQDSNGATLLVLTGVLDSGRALITTQGPSNSWGILHVSADGTPQSIERPEGTWCQLPNGESAEQYGCGD
jgi:hypothetical protein